ncbi:MAG: trimeric intracellular cation channel family protein [Gammaproteobacteria bacterium]|nr:trimeric intracellular cation channel family protein [Gammaproteobacteria bacterium]
MSTTYLTLGSYMYWIMLTGVAVSAAAGALEAGKKRFDLFGIIIVAIAAALGGGSVRDMMLGRAVFWAKDQTYLLVAIIAALITFFIARRIRVSSQVFQVPDAVGLSLFAIAGTNTAWQMDVPWLVASFMGVVTGVVGGVIRDVLCNEEPLVFQGTLYATAAWAGSLIYILLRSQYIDAMIAAFVASGFILLIRLGAIYWNIGLPTFRIRD